MGEEKGGKRGVQESACEDNGDSIKKYKDCDMIRFALQKADLYAGMKDGTKAGDNALEDSAKIKARNILRKRWILEMRRWLN